MWKRALLVLAAVIAVAGVLAFTVSPSPRASPGPPSPRRRSKGRAEHSRPAQPSEGAQDPPNHEVTKIARDYSHKHFRAVCADLTKKERKHLGGTSQCMLKMAVLNAFMPVKKFTIAKAKLTKRRAQGTVDVYVNGIKKHLVHAGVKWEGGAYRLDHESGWHPSI